MITTHQHTPAPSVMPFLQSLVVSAVGAFLVYLYFANLLLYYIRPDYNLFTVAMGTILLAIGLVNVLLHGRQLLPHRKLLKKALSSPGISQVVILCIVLAVGFFLPHRVLSSQAARRRGIDQNMFAGISIAQREQSLTDPERESTLFLTQDTEHFSLVDWVWLISRNPEPENYREREIKVSGFVQPNDDQTFTVGRFVLSCCAVDAAPIGLIVDAPLGTLTADDWVAIEGGFTVKEIAGERKIVISPKKN